jgi:hypothetical protein
MDSNSRQATLASAKWCVDNAVSSYGPLRHVYLQITEGRDSYGGFKYSWCGDFVTWALMQGGVIDGSALNRAALNNGKWQMGANISRLALWAKGHDALFVPGQGYEPVAGDPVIIEWPNGDHIGIFVSMLNSSHYESYDGNTFAGLCSRRVRNLQQTKAFICASALPTGINTVNLQTALHGGLPDDGFSIGVQQLTRTRMTVSWPTNKPSLLRLVAQGGNGSELPLQR